MPIGKFILAMLDATVLFVPVINKPVIGLESIGINDCIRIGLNLNNGYKLTYRAVPDNPGVNVIAPLMHPENRDFALGSSSTDSANSSRSEVAIIEFDLAVGSGTFRFTKQGNALSK